MMSVGSKIALFPCVGCLGDRTGGNHVQQVLSLTLDSRGGLMGRQAGVHIGHSHTCRQETNTEQSGECAGVKDFTLTVIMQEEDKERRWR